LVKKKLIANNAEMEIDFVARKTAQIPEFTSAARVNPGNFFLPGQQKILKIFFVQ
tara:strand:+ start:18 stop:182 length:165 start_codon:yes stop_codon:yes gene_type:complete